MKKIGITFFSLVVILVLATNVLAWGASRSISGNDVTLTVDVNGGTGIFTLQETVTGVTISSYPSSVCGLSSKVLTCDYADGDKAIVYQTTGTGSVTGTVTGGYPSTTKAITGDSTIPKAVPQPCTASDWSVGLWSSCSAPCGGGTQTSTVTKKAGSTCTGEGGKPAATQSCNTQACAPVPSCTDKIQNQAETGIDCGGPCAACQAPTLKVETTDQETYTLLTAIRDKLDALPDSTNTLQKISAIASALKAYFNK